jgi:hypothetical protein
MNKHIKAGLWTTGYIGAILAFVLGMAALNQYVWEYSGLVISTAILVGFIYNMALALLTSKEDMKKWDAK